MRQITEDAINAFNNNRKFSKSNTKVEIINGQPHLTLFGNLIAYKEIDSEDLIITNSNYFTHTTKERLNGFEEVAIQQYKGNWYIKDYGLWSGSYFNVTKNIKL